MALRRELLPLLLAAAFLLLGPAPALAAPTWLDAEQRDATTGLSTAPDVAAAGDGAAAVAWSGANGTPQAAVRPRGGPWGPAEELDSSPLFAGPLVTSRTTGELVAVWLTSAELRFATRTIGGPWTSGTIPGGGDDLLELEGTADGSVTLIVREDGGPVSYTLGAGSDVWGPRQALPEQGYDRFAFAPDGSTLGARLAGCGDTYDCLLASYRSPGAAGSWGDPVEVPGFSQAEDAAITGYAVAAAPPSNFTVVWGEAERPASTGTPVPPAAVRSSDRAPGASGPFADPLLVASLPATLASCPGSNCFDLAIGPDGRQVAVWQESGGPAPVMSAAMRPAGEVWPSAETVGPVGSSTAVPYAAVTRGLIPVVAWGSSGSGDGLANLSHRDPATGAWDSVARKRPRGLAPGTVDLADIAADGEGDALTAWNARDSVGVATAGFDATAPRFSAFTLPAGGLAGQTLGFAAAADDNWSGVAGISWLFGDGAGAAGAAVTHAYGAGGTFPVSATAQDGVGNTSLQSGSVNVGPPSADPCTAIGGDTDKDGIANCVDDNNGAARPRPFRTVNATVVSGEVFVKLPAGSARASQRKPPKGFVKLQGAETIPVGAQLDTTRGRVKVRSAATTGRKLQTGQFFRGRFQIRQTRIKRRSKRLITDMRLTGSSFRRTCRANRASISQRKRSKRRVRRLFGNAKGRFRTSGRNAAATVRGTRWSIQDRCDGTLVKVQSGRVQVRDKVKRRTVIVRTGRTYLARTR